MQVPTWVSVHFNSAVQDKTWVSVHYNNGVQVKTFRSPAIRMVMASISHRDRFENLNFAPRSAQPNIGYRVKVLGN